MCGECGKGFYRKDHLRKHANSHAAKRLKEELNARAAGLLTPIPSTLPANNNEDDLNTLLENRSDLSFARDSDIFNSNSHENISNKNNSPVKITNTQAAISLSTVYVSK